MSETTKVNLLNFDRLAMREFFLSLGEKNYHGDQAVKWIHQVGQTDFNAMSNLSKSLRQRLQEMAEIRLPEIVLDKTSPDGTRKWLLRLDDGNCIEAVFIPEKERGTLCVSSQVGCALNCSFCSTAKQGFNRNLSVAEIIGQVWIAARQLAQTKNEFCNQVTNVVMMGMGEPLLNFDNVVKAMNLMMDDFAYNLSKYRVTLSTSGVIPAMLQLKEMSEASLAVSLHAPNDALRNELVPLNKKYPIKELMAVCRDYFKGKAKRVVTFEYVMLKNVNDSEKQAHELAALLKNVPCKLNLIPFNPFPLTDYVCSSPDAIRCFQNILQSAGINTIVRRTRGDAIDAACGQLVGQVKDRTRRHDKWLRGKIPIVVETPLQ